MTVDKPNLAEERLSLDNKDHQLCAHEEGRVGSAKPPKEYLCPPIAGRYVIIQSDVDIPYLVLCEVEVYGPGMYYEF